MKSYYINEPSLYFREGNKCIDPKIGLLNFGPNELPEDNFEIDIGIIGSRSSLRYARQFLNRLRYNIQGKKNERSNIRGVNFPGVDKNLPLGFYFNVVEEYCERIPQETIEYVKSNHSREKKIILISQAFKQALQDLSGIQPRPKLVVISLPREVIKECKDPYLKKNDIKLFGRTYENLKWIAKQSIDERPMLIDFHHFIKVIGFEYNLMTQIVKPNTLNFSSTLEDQATIAWNFVGAAYYKSTRNPWKLADLDNETVYVGVSFYNDIGSTEIPVVRAAIAQIYSKTGDSQIIRGSEIPITDEEDRKTNLTEEQSNDLLNQAISLYRRQHNNNYPERIVLHKKSPFTNNEIEGFEKAVENVEIHDFIHLRDFTDFRVVTPSKYPIARGSVFQHKVEGKDEFYIFTSGYIPALDTYEGARIPKPIRICVEKRDSPIREIAEDIMHLTKLDWNSTAFAKRIPVTISTSEKVGEIMGEIALNRSGISLPSAYAYYM